VLDYRKRQESILTEFESFKDESQKEYSLMSNKYKDEIQRLNTQLELFSHRSDKNLNSEINSLKEELEKYKKSLMELQIELVQAQREKDSKNDEIRRVRNEMYKDLEAERVKYSIIQSDNDKLTHINIRNENDLDKLRNLLEDKVQENKILLTEKYGLLYELKEKEKEYDIFKSRLDFLKKKLEESENEYHNEFNVFRNKERDNLIVDFRKEEDSNYLIDELRRQLKEAHFEIEKIKGKSNIDDFIDTFKTENIRLKVEIKNLRNKLEIAENKNVETNIFLKSKIEEISNLNVIIKNLKTDEHDDELTNKIKNLIERKNFYKKQVITKFI
jgi:hypothetical protein